MSLEGLVSLRQSRSRVALRVSQSLISCVRYHRSDGSACHPFPLSIKPKSVTGYSIRQAGRDHRAQP